VKDELGRKNITEANDETLKIIAERSPDPVIIHDGERVLYANPKALEYVSPEDLMKRRLADFIHPDHRAIAVERISKVLRGEVVKPYEELFILPDGREVWFETNPTPITFRGKRAVLLILRDVTARKRTEERYRDFFDNSLDIIAVTDLKGNFIEVNKAFEETFGYTREEVRGRNFAEVLKLSKEVADEIFRAYNKAFRERKNLYGLLFKVKRKDSREIFVEGNVRLLWEGSKIIGFVGNFRDVTERIELEERLKESEEFHRSLIEESIAPVAILQNGVFVYVNKAFEEITGYRKEEIIGKSPFKFIHPEDIDIVAEKYQRLISGKDDVEFHDFRILSKSGQEIWARVRGTRITFKNEPAVAITGIDITELKEIQNKLKESKEKYRSIFNFSPLAIIVFDDKGRIVDWNKMAEEIFGWKREEALGNDIIELLVPEPLKGQMRQIAKRILKGEIYTHSINENLTKDGRIITCEWHNTIYRDAKGRIYGISIALDVTDKIKMERELKESEERYRAVFTHSPILIAILDKEGRFVGANPAMVKSIGENPIGKALSEIFPMDVAERRLRHLKKAFEEDVLVEFEDERSGKHFINSYLPIEVKGEKHSLVIAQDITELRKLNKLLRKMVEVNEAIVRINDREELVKKIEEILSDYSAKFVEKPVEGECLEIRHGEKTYGFLCVKNVDEEMKPLLRTLADDIAFALKSMEDAEKREEMLKQLVENIRTLAYLVDRIRNPLAAIRAFTEIYIEDEEVRNKIFQQIERIVEIVGNLDVSWTKSEKIAKMEKEIYDISKIEEEFRRV